MYKTILVILGPERRTTAALHRGVELARRSGAKLYLCQLVHYPMVDIARERIDAELATMAQREFMRAPREWLYAEGARLADHGINVECDVLWAPVPYEAALGKILEVSPDLVIKDADYDHGRVAHPERQTIDPRMLRTCPAPLMLVRPESAVIPRHLLGCVDVLSSEREADSMNSRIVATANGLGTLCEAQVDMASAYSYVPIGGEEFGGGMAAMFDAIEAAHKAASEDFCTRQSIPGDHMHRILGDAVHAMASCVEQLNVDIAIVGAAYRSVWDRLLMGATAEDLVRKLECDVLVLKPQGFINELGRHIKLDELRERYADQQNLTPA